MTESWRALALGGPPALVQAAMATAHTLLVLRHGKSSWADPGMDDFDRPLNARGHQAAAGVARALARSPLRPAIILCSSARRTRETLDALRPVLPAGTDVRIERGLYLADLRTLLAAIRDLPEAAATVLLIGHNPGLHELALTLSGSGDDGLRQRLAGAFPTAALATIELGRPWADVAAATGHLAAYAAPRDQD